MSHGTVACEDMDYARWRSVPEWRCCCWRTALSVPGWRDSRMSKLTDASKQRRPAAIPNSGSTLIARHAYWLMPLFLFLVVRLFSGDPYYLLGGDQCTFLELGRTFPKHQLFNHELYLIHPPLFGYAIGVFHVLLPLLASGLAATLVFACGNFLAVRELGQFEHLPGPAIFVGLIYLALSRPAVSYDYHVARVSPLVCATALAILAFLRLLRAPSRKALAWAIAANAACLMVSDQGLLLLPCEAVILWARGSFREWRWLTLAACSAAAALFWPLVRLVEFERRSDLPAGIDGMIEFTRNFPLPAVIQPNYLPFTNTHRSLFTQTSLVSLEYQAGAVSQPARGFAAVSPGDQRRHCNPTDGSRASEKRVATAFRSVAGT